MDRDRLAIISKWGTAQWASMRGALNGCDNLEISATDIPGVTGYRYEFGNFGHENRADPKLRFVGRFQGEKYVPYVLFKSVFQFTHRELECFGCDQHVANVLLCGELVQLKWATASEIGNDYFEVERSKDARIWEPMERIKGAGTVNSNQHYAATDTDPLTGATYYRLKIVEFSGHTDYSVIRSVSCHRQKLTSSIPIPPPVPLRFHRS